MRQTKNITKVRELLRGKVTELSRDFAWTKGWFYNHRPKTTCPGCPGAEHGDNNIKTLSKKHYIWK